MTKISIIIPAYNTDKYLSECIESVINQTLEDIEIICVNDGSTDGSLAILKNYASIDNRIIIINNENKGYGHSLNVGLDSAKGDYIGVVESDDFIRPNMYEELYNIAQESDAEIVKGDYLEIYGDGVNRRSIYHNICNDIGLYRKLIDPMENMEVFHVSMMTWEGIYKKGFLNKYKIRHNEMPVLLFRIMDSGFKRLRRHIRFILLIKITTACVATILNRLSIIW
jgi:glycosyltransferase involved in cell wall biosynthesis